MAEPGSGIISRRGVKPYRRQLFSKGDTPVAAAVYRQLFMV